MQKIEKKARRRRGDYRTYETEHWDEWMGFPSGLHTCF